MFKVKRYTDEKIFTVLSVFCEPNFHQTYFLIWENWGWRWRPADKFIPPAIDVDEFIKNDVPF
jgi:hypothetical protein